MDNIQNVTVVDMDGCVTHDQSTEIEADVAHWTACPDASKKYRTGTAFQINIELVRAVNTPIDMLSKGKSAAAEKLYPRTQSFLKFVALADFSMCKVPPIKSIKESLKAILECPKLPQQFLDQAQVQSHRLSEWEQSQPQSQPQTDQLQIPFSPTSTSSGSIELPLYLQLCCPVLKFIRLANVSGHNGIRCGYFFLDRTMLRVCGCHAHPQGGISGDLLSGARSIVVQHNSDYQDVDEGNTLKYEGTIDKNNPEQITRATQWMLASLNNGGHVRVIRGPNPGNRFAPSVYYRYDGLYKVVDAQQDRYRWIFTLDRLPDQLDLASLPRTPDANTLDAFRQAAAAKRDHRNGES